MAIYHTHHIIPRYLGGTNDPSNLVRLSLEEHAEAHRVLYEQYGNKQDYLAWKGLSNQIDDAELAKEVNKLSRRFSGKRHTEESKRKTSEALKGRPKSEEWNRKNSEGLKRAWSEGKFKPKPRSEESKKRSSEALKASWAKRKS